MATQQVNKGEGELTLACSVTANITELILLARKWASMFGRVLIPNSPVPYLL